MTLQEVRDEISRQNLLREGIRLIHELDRYQGACTSAGYTTNLAPVRDVIYSIMETVFPPDLKEKLKVVAA